MKLRNKKTGEIREFDKLGGFTLSDDYPSHYLADNTYNSIAKFTEEWEDYKPAEPLIKDEKIRKAVRAWAAANDIDKVYIPNNYCLSSEEDEEVEVVFVSPVFKEYVDWDDSIAIAELCGEEEE